MKKTYINPEMNVIKIATQQMLAASGPDGFSGGLNNSGSGGGNALGREDDWDDWDD
jgi:hypothetical protein